MGKRFRSLSNLLVSLVVASNTAGIVDCKRCAAHNPGSSAVDTTAGFAERGSYRCAASGHHHQDRLALALDTSPQVPTPICSRFRLGRPLHAALSLRGGVWKEPGGAIVNKEPSGTRAVTTGATAASPASGGGEKGRSMNRLRDAMFPIYGKQETSKFLALAGIQFFIIFVLVLTRDLKDTLIITSCGAEAISFLKVMDVELLHYSSLLSGGLCILRRGQHAVLFTRSAMHLVGLVVSRYCL